MKMLKFLIIVRRNLCEIYHPCDYILNPREAQLLYMVFNHFKLFPQRIMLHATAIFSSLSDFYDSFAAPYQPFCVFFNEII